MPKKKLTEEQVTTEPPTKPKELLEVIQNQEEATIHTNNLRKRMRGNRYKPEISTFRNSKFDITIDAQDRYKKVESKEDKIKEELVYSRDENIRKILTGTVKGWRTIRRGDEEYLFVIVDYKGVIVLISAKDFFYKDVSEDDVKTLKKKVAARNETEVDFIVTYIEDDDGNLQVLGNRARAMREKRNKYWFSTIKSNSSTPKYLLTEGKTVEARIVTAIRTGIFVEIFGVESFIPGKELSFTFLADAREEFKAGTNIMVTLTEVNRDNGISYSASFIAGKTDPKEKFFKQYKVGDNITGIVTNLEATATHINCYVNIDKKFDIYVRLMPGINKEVRIGQKVSIIIADKYEESLRMRGYIVHVFD